MRVLHVISGLDPRGGGVVSALAGLARALVAENVEVTIAATCKKKEDLSLVDTLREQKVNVELIGPCKKILTNHPQLKPTLDSLIKDADIVHVNALWEEIQYQSAKIAYRLGVPYIIQPHGMLDPWCLAQKKMKKKLYIALRLRKCLDHAAAIGFTSETEKRLTRPMNIKAPAIVEPNGVDLSEFLELPTAGSFRERYPQIGDRRIVLFLSRLHYKKGLDLLVPAFPKAQTGNAVLVIAGPDSDGYRSKVEAMAHECGIADRVIFTGMLYGEERVAAFVDADLFVLPSYQENFGIVVIEALASGTPVVVSTEVNIHDQITKSGVGGVVPTETNALADELTKWLTDDALCRSASQRARPFVWEQYDWSKIAQNWKQRYHKILNR